MSWPTARLGDLVDAIIDHRGKTPLKMNGAFSTSGFPVLSAKHVKTGKLVSTDQIRFVNDTLYKKWMKVEVEKNDIIVTSEAPLGEVYVVPDETKYVLGQRVFGLRANKTKVYPHYLAAWLASPKGQGALNGRSTGTTVLGIKQSELIQIEVDVPPLEVQETIASMSYALDAKIELNRRINETLEAMARAIFKDWFVDFGPTRAKMEGRSPYLAPDLWALFPDTLGADGLPAGWEIGKVDDILELAYGEALKATNRVSGNVPVYGSGGITGHHNESLVNGPSIIVGRKGTVGSIYWEEQPCFPIDTVFYVRPKAPLVFCLHTLQILGLHNMNTDAAVPGLNRNNVYRLPICLGSPKIVEAFSNYIGLLRMRESHNDSESLELANARNMLLPKLMTGELRVSGDAAT
ncbi:MAG: restriction endonuclease subunit S [Proteobacteria bacterium]|nr:restriction endonuclease subunit S [Pseudomonadota bacterium]